MRIILIGPPGAGKGTQCQRLVNFLQVPHLSTGEMLRDAISKNTAEGKEASSFMENGQLVPDQLVPLLLQIAPITNGLFLQMLGDDIKR